MSLDEVLTYFVGDKRHTSYVEAVRSRVERVKHNRPSSLPRTRKPKHACRLFFLMKVFFLLLFWPALCQALGCCRRSHPGQYSIAVDVFNWTLLAFGVCSTAVAVIQGDAGPGRLLEMTPDATGRNGFGYIRGRYGRR